MQSFQNETGAAGVTGGNHVVVLRFGRLGVHRAARDEALRARFGDDTLIVNCGEIRSVENVLSLVAEYGATVLDWIPSTNRPGIAKRICQELEDAGTAIVRPMYFHGRFDGYADWRGDWRI